MTRLHSSLTQWHPVDIGNLSSSPHGPLCRTAWVSSPHGSLHPTPPPKQAIQENRDGSYNIIYDLASAIRLHHSRTILLVIQVSPICLGKDYTSVWTPRDENHWGILMADYHNGHEKYYGDLVGTPFSQCPPKEGSLGSLMWQIASFSSLLREQVTSFISGDKGEGKMKTSNWLLWLQVSFTQFRVSFSIAGNLLHG